VFVKKSNLSSWVFTATQSVHIWMNLSLSPPLKKILDPPMSPFILLQVGSIFFALLRRQPYIQNRKSIPT